MAKLKGHLQQQAAGVEATKDKTKGNQQQQVDIVSSSAALPPQVDKSPKRKAPRDRSSPSAGSPRKKNKTAPDTNLEELASVEGFEETASPTTIESAPPTIESAPPTIESAPTTIESAFYCCASHCSYRVLCRGVEF